MLRHTAKFFCGDSHRTIYRHSKENRASTVAGRSGEQATLFMSCMSTLVCNQTHKIEHYRGQLEEHGFITVRRSCLVPSGIHRPTLIPKTMRVRGSRRVLHQFSSSTRAFVTSRNLTKSCVVSCHAGNPNLQRVTRDAQLVP